MPAINFIGPSYSVRSSNVDCQRTINMFPDINEIGNGKVQYFFNGTPGLKLLLETSAKVRAMFVDSKGDLYTVEGQEFCKYAYDDVDDNGQVYLRRTVKGGIYTTDTDISIAENGFQICVVDGEHLYVYIYKDDTFQEYTPTGFLGSYTVSYYDTYFVFVQPDTQIYFISSIYDATIMNAGENFQLKENYPDNLVTCVSFNNYLWLLGEKTLQILYNSGDTFPLSNMSGGTANIGCIARKSVAICSNTLFWIGKDDNGFGTVYMTQGNNNPSKVSNFAVDYFLQSQEDLSNATAYAYQEDGHNFYVVNFPNAQTTWVYDFATQMWHERQSLNVGSDVTRHRSEHHVVWKNKHLVSDYKENKIYEMSLDFYDENGHPIRRYRRSPNFAGTELERQFFNEFQLDMELGNPDFQDAKIFLRYSNDSGKTWSDFLTKSCGKTGEYRHRLIWRRLGTARDRTWEVSITDPIKFTLLNAYVR